jgi:predicted PurR-regulated permease PerM
MKRDRWTLVAITAWGLIGVLLLVAAGFWLVGKVSSALVPFLFAILIVYLFRGPVLMLEHRGLKRGLAVGVCYLAGFGGLAILSFFVLPALFDQVGQFVRDFPKYYDGAYKFWLDLQREYQAVQIPGWLDKAIVDLSDTLAEQAMAWSSAAAKGIFQFGSSAVTFLFNGFIAVVIAFWLLKDLPEISRELTALAGPEREQESRIIAQKVSQVLGGYLRGQLIISASTAVIVSLGLAILGVPYALVLGLLAGILNVIPYIGPLIAEVTAAIVAVFVSPVLALGAVAVIMAAQQLTDYFIQPRVMSEQVDLHPVLVIFSLLAGGTLFGFPGLLLAIPVAAIAKGLFVYYFEKWTDSTLTTEDGALFRQRKTGCGPDDADSELACDETTDTEETT